MNSIKRKWIGSRWMFPIHNLWDIYLVILAVMGLILTLWNLPAAQCTPKKHRAILCLERDPGSAESFRLAFMTALDAISINSSRRLHVDVNDNPQKPSASLVKKFRKSAWMSEYGHSCTKGKDVDELNKNSFVDNMETRLRQGGTLFPALLSSRSLSFTVLST